MRVERKDMFLKYFKFFGVLLFMVACLAAYFPAQSFAGQSVESDDDPYVIRSFERDVNEYRYLALDNGLQALLVHEPDAVQSSAVLSVNVGALHDPEGWDGLAHYLEHMLFLGTEKYPDTDEYASYLRRYGGNFNAMTEYDHTNYFFIVGNEGFDGSLDRFAQFFIAPLFNEEYVEREKNAVHAEYSTRVEVDMIRRVEVFENVINPKHPAIRFNAGNRDSLADKPNQTAREALIEFYEQHYSADRMTLALVSDKPLDELEQQVRDTFSAVPSFASAPELEVPPLFVDGDLPKVIEIKPVMEQRSLTLTFPIEQMQDYFREDPISFIAILFNNSEVENSLSDRLKEKGWIIDMGFGAGMDYIGNDTLAIGVNLTEEGMNHQDEIIAAMFDQIALVKEEGVKEWRYKELKNVSEMGFRFADKGRTQVNALIHIAKGLHFAPPGDLVGPGFRQYDEGLLNSVLASLHPENAVVTLSAPEVKPDRETRFYGAEYRVYRPSAERVARWSEPLYTDLELPEPNPLIAENFEMEKIESLDEPLMLSDSGLVELWHLPNIKEGIPKAIIQLAVDRPDRVNAREGFILRFYFSMLAEQLEELAHMTRRASLTYTVGNSGVSFVGFSDKLPELADLVLAEVLNPRFTQQQFDNRMEQLERSVRNYYKVSPSQSVRRGLTRLLNADSRSMEEQLEAVRSITMEDILAAPEWIYGESKVQMLASGNVTEAQAHAFADRIVSTLGISGTDRERPLDIRLVRVAESEDPRDVFIAEVEHHDTAVLRYYQGRESTQKERITLSLLGQMLGQPYYNELRTEQQLGYIVQASYVVMADMPGLIFMVQSPTADGSEIETATDLFLPEFREILAEKTAEDLDKLKQTSLDQLGMPPANFGETVGRFWGELREGNLEFDTREQAIVAISEVTLDDIREAYDAVVLNNPRMLSVIAPGALGGIEGTIESAEAFHEDNEIIVRTREDRKVASR